MHLSRLAEEIVIWATPSFGFIKLSDAFSTGSSIMPQKKNPDAAELVRAKIGRILGSFVALTTVMKGLALAYAKDLQEDKEQVFQAADALDLSLAAMAGMVEDLTAVPQKMRAAAEAGFPTATDLADWCVRTLGTPFREAHHIAGAIVKRAEELNCTLENVPLAEMQTDRKSHHQGCLCGAAAGGFGDGPHELRRHGPGARARADRVLAGETRMIRRLFALFALSLMVAACGVKTDLLTPSGKPSQGDRHDPSKPDHPLGR